MCMNEDEVKMKADFVFTGIPTDEEQATGLEKVIMKAMKQGEVRQHTTHRNSDIMCSKNMKNVV